MRKIVETLRRVAARQHPDAATDAELLEAYLADRDEVAFEGLVRRHGGMVLGVCRRILGHVQDAEDAFQATFLVLVRKAASILPREYVGNWLYGVAQQTARKARAGELRRATREQTVAVLPEAPTPAVEPNDVLALIDRELGGLPANYRAAIILCDLEGHSGREAARLLGWPEGTLFTRLTRGRKLLAERLGRRGVDALAVFAGPTLTPTLITTTVQAAAATALGPAAAAAVVSPAVATLTEGVLQAMIPLKVKFTAVLVVVASLVGVSLGAGGSYLLAPAPKPVPEVAEQPVADEPPAPLQPLDARFLERLAVAQPQPDNRADLIRRYYLDAHGRLPQADEVKRSLELPLAELDSQLRERIRRYQQAYEAQTLYQQVLEAQQREAEEREKARRLEAFHAALLKARQLEQQKLVEALLKGLDDKAIAELVKQLERRQAIAGVTDAIAKEAAKARAARGKQGEVELLDALLKSVQELKEKAQKK